jgi:Protein involved in formate dehydrogenase formation
MPERDADVLEILIGQMAQYPDINFVLGKTLRHTYAKMMYKAHDIMVDAFADDLATLGLDLMVAEAGWARNAPNPLLLVGSADMLSQRDV